jgi:hypothetical protein
MSYSANEPPPERKCSPFRFSNDKWSSNAVNKLQRALRGQHTPPETSAALVVGAGGLPYLLSHLDTRRVFGVDLSEDVLALTAWRINQLNRFSNWDGYHYGVQTEIERGRTPQRHCYTDEFLTAEESGLQGDFARAREAGGSTEFTFIRGDLRVMAPHIGLLATQEDRKFTFVNFTNVATYLATGRAALYDVLDALPLADDAVIVDSAPHLQPEVHVLDQYRARGPLAV